MHTACADFHAHRLQRRAVLRWQLDHAESQTCQRHAALPRAHALQLTPQHAHRLHSCQLAAVLLLPQLPQLCNLLLAIRNGRQRRQHLHWTAQEAEPRTAF